MKWSMTSAKSFAARLAGALVCRRPSTQQIKPRGNIHRATNNGIIFLYV